MAEARRHGATAVAHGCTGKGNDQVRFEVGTRALAPDLEVLAPARLWGLTREDCIEYAAKWDIPISVTKEKLYSIDENLWGRAIECGVIEDPWNPPPEDVYTMTRPTATGARRGRSSASSPASRCPSTACRSRPSRSSPRSTGWSASYGFGRLDMVENRRVGIKSREIYECPAALALLLAHADLEDLTLERDLHHEKARLEPRWSELVYDGLWFSPAQAGARRVLRRVAASRHRRGAAALRRAGRLLGGRPPQPGRPLRPRAGHLRRLRHLPPPGCRGIRAALGPRRRHLVGPPGTGSAAAPAGARES